MKMKNGFTLIEIMIAIAVVAILTAIAVPSYTDYVRRGKIAEATSALANMRVQMEQYFQDNKTYANVTGVTAPCTAGAGTVPLPAGTKYFTFDCDTPARAAVTFTLTATGIATQGMGGFVYTVNQANAQVSTISGAAASAGYVTNGTCWVVRRGTGAVAC